MVSLETWEGRRVIKNRTPMKFETGQKGPLSSLLPVSSAENIGSAFIHQVSWRETLGWRNYVTKQAIILIAKSFNSSQTFKMLAAWLMVVSVNWYLLILVIYFQSKCKSDIEYNKCLHGEKKTCQFVLQHFFCIVCIPSWKIPQVFTMQCSNWNPWRLQWL